VREVQYEIGAAWDWFVQDRRYGKFRR